MADNTHTDWTDKGSKDYLVAVSEIAQNFIESPDLPEGIEIEDIEFIVNDSSIDIDFENRKIKAMLSYCFSLSGVPDALLDDMPGGADVEITASLDTPFEIK
jgi:hypothetical protein